MPLRLNPYLMMDGNAREAIEFYEKALEAKLVFFETFGESSENNEQLPPEAKDRVLHAMMKVGETDLMFSDTFPGSPHSTGNQVTICVSIENKEQTKKIFDALQEGGKVDMELQETFFSPAYAVVTDKFGVTFQLYTESQQGNNQNQ